MASALSSAAAAASPAHSDPIPLSPALSRLYGRNWKVVDCSDGSTVDPSLVQSVIEPDYTKLLTESQKTFLTQIDNNLAFLTTRKCAQLFANIDIEDGSSTYDKPLLDPSASEAKTMAAALTFFGYGCNPDTKNEWMNCFAEESGYIIASKSAITGKRKIRAHLETLFKGSPPLTYPMVILEVKHNMTIAFLINKLNDGRGFPLVSLNFFDNENNCIFNGDFYNFYEAAGEVIWDLVTVPADGCQVIKQQTSGCTII